jgi:aldose 1-epimerase
MGIDDRRPRAVVADQTLIGELIKMHRFMMALAGVLVASQSAADDRIHATEFGMLDDGRVVMRYEVSNRHGASVEITNWGGVILAINVPDRAGVLEDVTLGYDELARYVARNPHYGAVAGRYANRIEDGRLALDGRTYQLTQNNGKNHLHGGKRGFYHQLWTAEPFETADSVGVRLGYISADGEEGYPGELTVHVTYTFDDDNHLTVDYEATTDKATIVNLTQHTYFNLGGHDTPTIDDHVLKIDADFYLAMTDDRVSSGAVMPVEDTPIDFRVSKPVGQDIDADHPVTDGGAGYGRYMVLNHRELQNGMTVAARVLDPASGRTMTVLTEELGFQFYSGNNIPVEAGKHGVKYGPRRGMCFETHGFPNAPNIPHFPSSRLDPGEVYKTRTVFAFSVHE